MYVRLSSQVPEAADEDEEEEDPGDRRRPGDLRPVGLRRPRQARVKGRRAPGHRSRSTVPTVLRNRLLPQLSLLKHLQPRQQRQQRRLQRPQRQRNLLPLLPFSLNRRRLQNPLLQMLNKSHP